MNLNVWESLEEYKHEQFGVIKVTGPPSLCLVSFYQIRKGQTRPLCWGQRCICIKTHRKLNSQLMKQIDFFILSELKWNEMASSGQESVPSFNTVLSEIINECLEHNLWKRNGLNPLTPEGQILTYYTPIRSYFTSQWRAALGWNDPVKINIWALACYTSIKQQSTIKRLSTILFPFSGGQIYWNVSRNQHTNRQLTKKKKNSDFK